MKNPSWNECIAHIKAGGGVAVERISDDEYDFFYELDDFVDYFPEDEYEEDAADREFRLMNLESD